MASPASVAQHPAAPHDFPAFIVEPGQSDTLLNITIVFLILATLGVGLLFLRIHTLPERMAHRRQKLQFEIVAVLGLLALFTHIHWFWVAGLLLALIDIPDLGKPLRRIAYSTQKLAGVSQEEMDAALETEREKALEQEYLHDHPDAAAKPARKK